MVFAKLNVTRTNCCIRLEYFIMILDFMYENMSKFSKVIGDVFSRILSDRK